MRIPTVKPLVFTIPKDNNFHIAEGRYRATVHKFIRSPRQSGHGCEDNLRILFEVSVPGKTQFTNLAKAEFPLNLEHGSALRNVLTRILGKEKLAELSGHEFDFETLIGMEVDVEVEHIITSKRDQYPYPLVQVRDIQPPGTWVVAQEGVAKP